MNDAFISALKHYIIYKNEMITMSEQDQIRKLEKKLADPTNSAEKDFKTIKKIREMEK